MNYHISWVYLYVYLTCKSVSSSRQGQGQAYLCSLALTEQLAQKGLLGSSSLQPAALARAALGPFLSRQRLWLQPQRKAQAPPQLTMGPLSQLVRALSGKTRPLPLHLSPKPAPRELQGSTQRRSPRSDSRVPRPPSRPGRAARFPGGWWVGGLPSHSC